MDRQFGHERYRTTYFEDRSDGSAGLLLRRERSGTDVIAAQVVFWDATGQLSVETFNGDVPAEIVEAIIAEARELIRVQ